MQPTTKRGEIVTASAVTLLCACGVWPLLRIGWVPSDEGTLAQSALRVFQGQLPHRDFAEIYTGGLALLHALAFHVFGVNLFALRLVTFALFLIWVPVVYWIARRWLGAPGGTLATLAAVAWSYPNYVAAMPSWYNLFFATFGVAALLRYVEKKTTRWLFFAGFLAGLSMLVKVTGLYFIAAALIWFAWMEQSKNTTPEQEKAPAWFYRTVCALGLLGFLTALTKLLSVQLNSGEAYSLLLPSFLCVAFWFQRERATAGSNSRRFVTLLKMVLPFLLGTGAVVLMFLIPYLRSGSVKTLWVGVAQSVSSRAVQLAGRTMMPSMFYALYAVVLVSIAVFAIKQPHVATRRGVVLLIGSVLMLTILVSSLLPGLQDTWMMFGMATPLIVAFGLWRIGRRELSGVLSERALLLIAFAALCSLVQFPVSYVTYFCYVAPLVLLAAIAVFGDSPRPLNTVAMAFLLLFACFALVPKHIYDPELQLTRAMPLAIGRAGLRVDDSSAQFAQIIRLVQAHSPDGMLYAGNDCPELYFLSGLKNPTRDDTGASAPEVLHALQSGQLHVVALNDASFFASGNVSDNLRSAIARRLPHMQKIGSFSIYWD